MHYDHINVPADGEAITVNPDHTINVPNFPIIPYIEGDGIGSDITPVMLNVVEAAVEIAYGDDRQINERLTSTVRMPGCPTRRSMHCGASSSRSRVR